MVREQYGCSGLLLLEAVAWVFAPAERAIDGWQATVMHILSAA